MQRKAGVQACAASARLNSMPFDGASFPKAETGVSTIASTVEADIVIPVIASASATACSRASPGVPRLAALATAAGTRLSWKQERQKTGRPCVGLNGTVVSTPQAEHSVRVSVRERGRAAAATAPSVERPRPARLALHSLHRLGSFLNWRSEKKSCSPAVKMKSFPQSEHFSTRSVNSIAPSPTVGQGVSRRQKLDRCVCASSL